MKCLLIDIDDTLYKHKTKFTNYDNITEDRQLTRLINSIKLPKYIYTNAMFSHANSIVNKLNIENNFLKIYSRDTIPSMKPQMDSAISVENDIRNNNDKVTSIIFFDDLLENLNTGKNKGWTTIWIHPDFKNKNKYSFIDYAAPDIKTALKNMRYNLI